MSLPPITHRSFLKSASVASSVALFWTVIASRLPELCLLSNVAVRARRSLGWDLAAMKVTNLPEANQYLTKTYRPGFGV